MGTPKEGEKELVDSLPGLVFNREFIFHSGKILLLKITLTSEDVESLCDSLRYTGEEIITVLS